MALPIGTRGVAVTLADPAPAALLAAGDRVEFLAAPPDGARAQNGKPLVLAANVPVVAVAAGDFAAVVLLALSPEQARRTVRLPAGTRLSVLLLP